MRELIASFAIVVIVVSQLPAVGVIYAWFTLGLDLEDRSGWLLLLGFFAPAFMLVGWLVAIPTLLVSPRARRNPFVWVALLVGVAGVVLRPLAIGSFR